MGNERALNTDTGEQGSYRHVGDSVAAAKVMLMELESLVGNLYLAKDAAKKVVVKVGAEAHSAHREEQQ